MKKQFKIIERKIRQAYKKNAGLQVFCHKRLKTIIRTVNWPKGLEKKCLK